jgi:hypothetical protein
MAIVGQSKNIKIFRADTRKEANAVAVETKPKLGNNLKPNQGFMQ